MINLDINQQLKLKSEFTNRKKLMTSMFENRNLNSNTTANDITKTMKMKMNTMRNIQSIMNTSMRIKSIIINQSNDNNTNNIINILNIKTRDCHIQNHLISLLVLKRHSNKDLKLPQEKNLNLIILLSPRKNQKRDQCLNKKENRISLKSLQKRLSIKNHKEMRKSSIIYRLVLQKRCYFHKQKIRS